MVAVSALTVLASASTTLAYQPMQSSDMSVGENIQNDNPSFTKFISFNVSDDIDFSKGNLVFVSEDGEQITVSESENSIPYALCTHSMVDGYLYNHIPLSSGGCKMKVYTCQRCKKCGYLANAVYSHTITSTKCTH